MRNVLAIQQADGLLPGALWFKCSPPSWNLKGYPQVWVRAVDEICRAEGDAAFACECFEPLLRVIGWYERKRKCEDGGFHYTFDACWESGIDEGIRFDNSLPESKAAVDACSHVYMLYEHAARWAKRLEHRRTAELQDKAKALRQLIQTRLFDAETGFFHDIWSVGKPELRCLSFEGIWPLAAGAASPGQAMRVIDENLLNPERFLSAHPLATVALCDPRFEPRMWRGPAWNSMTYWAALGGMRYGRADAACVLLERALDASCKQFARTGTIWEFYDALGGEPEKLHRKPGYDKPSHDYLGHNPLIAMARLWQETKTDLTKLAVKSGKGA
jgi:glycogen debranching enzyme